MCLFRKFSLLDLFSRRIDVSILAWAYNGWWVSRECERLKLLTDWIRLRAESGSSLGGLFRIVFTLSQRPMCSRVRCYNC
jgi:hypothetical protein